MAETVEVLKSVSERVSTSSTKQRVRIFRNDLRSVINGSEMSADTASQLVDIIFQTLFVYDDPKSRKSVDDVIAKGLGEVTFMKCFASTLVQTIVRQLNVKSHVGCYKLLKWSCLLLTKSQFVTVSRNALWRIATAQASLLHILLQGSVRVQRACRRLFLHLFSQLPNLYKIYVEELKDSRIPCKDSAELIFLLLEFWVKTQADFEQHKPIFLDIYVKAVLSAKDRPSLELSEAFQPLFTHMSREDLESLVVPSSLKMLKRNPEIVLESVGVLLKLVNLDLSKYAREILSVILPHARHAEEGRRLGALAIVGVLSKKSSDPDSLQAMFTCIKAVIGGSEGRLVYPYQRVGMINALRELSKAPDGRAVNNLAPTICSVLLSCYKKDGNQEEKLAALSALASWAARSAETIKPEFISFIANGLKEKEPVRRGHLRLLRSICKDSDICLRISSLLVPLVQLVKTGFTKATQRLDVINSFLVIAKIAAIDTKAEYLVANEKLWTLISQNEPSVVSISLVPKLSSDDCIACVDLLEVLLVEHLHRVLKSLSVRSLLQSLLHLVCHPSWDVRKVAYDALKNIITRSPQLCDDLLLEFTSLLSVVGERMQLIKLSDAENLVDAQVLFLPSIEVLVRALLVISSRALDAGPNACGKLIFCSHHPCLVNAKKRDAVWKRLSRSLQTQGFDVISVISDNLENICTDLVGQMGLLSSSSFEQNAAKTSLSALMSIVPKDTYIEFEKHLSKLPEHCLHDGLSESCDIQEQDVNDSQTFGIQPLMHALSQEHLDMDHGTTLAGFCLTEAKAVVMAGDGQLTVGTAHGNSHRVKIHRVGKRLICGNSGIAKFSDMARTRIKGAVDSVEREHKHILSVRSYARIISTFLKDEVAAANFPKEEEGFSYLLGGCDADADDRTPHLWLLDNFGYWEMPTYCCVGAGRFYADLEAKHFKTSMGVEYTIYIALRSIFCATKHDYYTGGDIRVLVIEDAGITYYQTSIKKLTVFFG